MLVSGGRESRSWDFLKKIPSLETYRHSDVEFKLLGFDSLRGRRREKSYSNLLHLAVLESWGGGKRELGQHTLVLG